MRKLAWETSQTYVKRIKKMFKTMNLQPIQQSI